MVEGESAKIVANKIGRVAFLEPDALISPETVPPPLMSNLSIYECFFNWIRNFSMPKRFILLLNLAR